MTVDVQVDLRHPAGDELRRIMGPEFEAFLRERVGANLIQAVRRNMRINGDPAGDWPQLNGYNQGTTTRKQAKATRKALRAADAYDDVSPGRRGALTRQAQSTSKHAGYAKQKADGKTPGKGKFGPGIRLRDTGALIESANVKVIIDGDNISVALTFDGTAPGRSISNEQLAAAHFEGRGRLPKRSPVEPEDMRFFEEKTGQDIARWISEHLM